MTETEKQSNSYVLVVDRNGQPLMPCLSARAYFLRKTKRARIYCMQPFTIQILDRTVKNSILQETQIKLDPGSKTTGMALTVKGDIRGWFVSMAIHIQHRSHQIRDGLTSRRQSRRSRRNRKTRYRAPRFSNRARHPRVSQGYSVWLSPSVVSRIENIVNLTKKFSQYFPVERVVGELNKFDTQKMLNPEIAGIEYQQGTLQGFEVREYLLQKYQYTCVYCQKCAFTNGKSNDIRLEIDHVVPRSKGGSNSVSNLVLACHPCNQKKENQSLADFLKKKPAVLKRVQDSFSKSLNLQDAAQMNIMRKELYSVLAKRLLLPVDTSTASQTKYNRVQQKYQKDHWLDAACVGETGNHINIQHISNINIWKTVGRGHRQMCLMNKYGFPNSKAKSVKRYRATNGQTFQTGDTVKLVQPSGQYKGTYTGVVSIRARGQFDITTGNQKIPGHCKNFTNLVQFNGYHVKPIRMTNG